VLADPHNCGTAALCDAETMKVIASNAKRCYGNWAVKAKPDGSVVVTNELGQ
jgi:hypothetical protein